MTVATRLPFVISLWKKSVCVRCLRESRVRVRRFATSYMNTQKHPHNATSVNRFLSEYLSHPSTVPKSTKTSTLPVGSLEFGTANILVVFTEVWIKDCSRRKAPTPRNSGDQHWNQVTGSFGSPCGSRSPGSLPLFPIQLKTVRIISFLLGSLVLVFPSFSNGPYVTSSPCYVTSLPTSRVIRLVRLLLAFGKV